MTARKWWILIRPILVLKVKPLTKCTYHSTESFNCIEDVGMLKKWSDIFQLTILNSNTIFSYELISFT